MPLFDFLKRKPDPTTVIPTMALNVDSKEQSDNERHVNAKIELTQPSESPDVPENIFIEYAKPKPKQSMEPNEANSEANDLKVLYRYLEQSREKKGYEDALINPDTSYMEEQIVYIGNELGLLLSKIKSYYSGYMRKIDFHIETRKRSGMIETVDELMTHRETILEEIQIVAAIEADSINGKGLSQNPVLSYKKGFRNGFAAITYNSVLGRRS